MLASFYSGTGAAHAVLQIGEFADPLPGPGEVRVRVRASGINPADVKLRSGRARRAVQYPNVIPHNDGAGDIDQVGEGVAAQRVGERVWVFNAQYFRPHGTAAQYVVVPAHQAVPLPGNLDYLQGACLGIPLQTAWHAVTRDGDISGQTVLVTGGAGAVGRYAIQIARAKGARVIATVSSAHKAGEARAAGAEHVIDYRSEDVASRVAEITHAQGVDRLIEVNLSSNAALVPLVVRPFGTVVVYGTDEPVAPVHALSAIARSVSYRFFVVYEIAQPIKAAMQAELHPLLASGAIDHGPIHTFGLREIADAHVALESGRLTGKAVLEIGDTP